MTLYEINKELEELVNSAVDPETGEIDEKLVDRLEELQINWAEKVENIGCFIKNLRADAEALKQEKLNLAKRQQFAENKADRLEHYLSDMLAGQTFSSPKVDVRYRKSVKVICDDLKIVPEEYLKHKDPEIDKTAIKQAIKGGEVISGCHLEESNNIQVR